MLLIILILSACVPADRYTTNTRTTPRSRYYQTARTTDSFPPSGEVYRVGSTFRWLTSYYGEEFHGKQTANGEIFNMNGLTCAHRELPFDTLLKVTNPITDQSVTVRVNDRGPFVKGRDLDLAQGAAQRIGLIDRGVKELLIEILTMPE
ncbi:MAG: septal ring lytic transglycosylase RlpA family protein [Candidatus Cloacimonetes bacterium]|nr:septal ring lytic transglycosylase RlpA family protein [Candidatus Cloacimonadota bacterium]